MLVAVGNLYTKDIPAAVSVAMIRMHLSINAKLKMPRA